MIAETRTEYDATGLDPSDRSPVEIMELAPAAGSGAETFYEEPVGLLWFRNDWLRRHSIDPKQAKVAGVSGDSMDPTLPNGCSILIDRKRTEPQDERIYVLRTEDGLVVKRLRQDEGGWWQVVSDNPDSETWPTVPLNYGSEVIGEVRWAARTF